MMMVFMFLIDKVLEGELDLVMVLDLFSDLRFNIMYCFDEEFVLIMFVDW